MHPHPRSGQRCALLFYTKAEAAEDAIKVLNGIYKIREDAERPIKVAWAKEKQPEKGGEKGSACGDVPMKTMDQDGFKLFVGGLPVDVKEEELRMVFGTYGEVNKVHIMPPHGQSNRVAAFIFYAKSESADDAIHVLDRQYKIRTDAEHPIEVKWANTKDKGAGKGAWNAWDGGNDWSSWGGGKGGAAGGKKGWEEEPQKMRNQDGWKLFVGGLPKDVTEEELHTVFTTYGEVSKVHVMPPHQMSGRVAAFVFYVAEQAAEDSIKVLNGIYKIREDAEAPIQVRWASDKPIKGDGKGDGGKCGGAWAGGAWNSWGGGATNKGASKGGKAALGWQDTSGTWSGGAWQGDQGASWSGNWQGNQAAGWQGGAGGAGGWNGGSSSWDQGGKKGGKQSWSGEPKGEQKGKGWQGGKGEGKGGDGADTKLFVGNLPDDVSEEALQYVFGTYGKVSQVHIMTGKSRTGNACAFVEFVTASDAETAILTLNDKYEIKPGCGPILVKKANSGNARSKPY